MKPQPLLALTATALLTLTACSQTPQAADGDIKACNLYKEAVDIIMTQADDKAHNDQNVTQVQDMISQAAETAEDVHLQDKLMLTNNNFMRYAYSGDPDYLVGFAKQPSGIVDACEAAGAPIKLHENVKLDQ